MIDGELDDLGRAVQEVLEDYLTQKHEASDYGWGGETDDKREE